MEIMEEIKALLVKVSDQISPDADNKKLIKLAKLHKTLSGALEIAIGLTDQPKQEAVSEQPKQEAVEITEVTEDAPAVVCPVVMDQPTTSEPPEAAKWYMDRDQLSKGLQCFVESVESFAHGKFDQSHAITIVYETKDGVAYMDIPYWHGKDTESDVCGSKSGWSNWRVIGANHKTIMRYYKDFVLRMDVWRDKDNGDEDTKFYVVDATHNHDEKHLQPVKFYRDMDKGGEILVGSADLVKDRKNVVAFDWDTEDCEPEWALSNILLGEDWHYQNSRYFA